VESEWAAVIAAVCLLLWLTEVVPPFVPTLLLLVGASLLPGGSLQSALSGMADPVLALFFGGFVLGEAASVHGIDRLLARRAFLLAGGQVRWLVGVVLGVTAFLSMWMSNIAAAALMIAAMKPMFGSSPEKVRRALLVAVAFGANLGGMATPIGTGPNALAMAQIPGEPPSFLAWMAFALPLTVGSLAVAYTMLLLAHPLRSAALHIPMAGRAEGERPLQVGGVALLAVMAWLLEPLHGVSAAVVALALAATLFGTRLVPAARLHNVDWSTLLLIAGGLGLGELIEQTGLLGSLASWLDGQAAPPWLLRMALLSLTALMSALMSNTATAALLIPLASAMEPESRALPILVALAASFGMPFVISTPPNAMAVGAGANARDLLWPGLLLMAGGCLVLAATGPAVLGWFVG
jgi:sodium-dependent dicarboxylate transporter 2/3/5